MNTCDTCKHWEMNAPTKVYEEVKWISIMGECQILSDETGQDVQIGYYSNSEAPVVDETAAFASASDTHGLGFYCGPKFGCIHWEAK